MRRRRILQAIGAIGGVSLAGCLRSSSSTETPFDTPPPQNADRFPASFPEYEEDIQETIGYDYETSEHPAAALRPAKRGVEPGESIGFQLRNNRTQTLWVNFYAWRTHKYIDGTWYYILPQGWNQPVMQLDPGTEHTWTVTVDNAGIEAGRPVPKSGGTEQVTAAGLGGGTYAFGTAGWFDDSDHTSQIAFSTHVEVLGDEITLTPTNAIVETAHDGETVTARSDRNVETGRRGVYELTAVETTTEARSMITEQVIRDEQLRDALALQQEHEVEQVRIEEYTGVDPAFGIDDPEVITYDGQIYRITARELGPEEGQLLS